VTTTDFMTAEAFNFPWDFLQRVMNRIVNEVHGYVATAPLGSSQRY
jgi:GMP synthase (glutamine-hydrolysing)